MIQSSKVQISSDAILVGKNGENDRFARLRVYVEVSSNANEHGSNTHSDNNCGATANSSRVDLLTGTI